MIRTMRLTLRSFLTLSRSLRQRVISRFNSISAVGLSSFGSGRFDAMRGTPGRILNCVKARESVVADWLEGEALGTHPNRPMGIAVTPRIAHTTACVRRCSIDLSGT